MAPKKTTYKHTDRGLFITDKRQTTNGAIVPNYVVDLYLPIVGYDGLGVLTMLYRLANSQHRVITDLNKYARAGRLGFRKFDELLSTLEECGIIKVHKPKGKRRVANLHTEIELLDPPLQVPDKYTETVVERAIPQWLIAKNAEYESEPESEDDSPKMSGNTFRKCQVTLSGNVTQHFEEMSGNIPKDVTSVDVTSDDESGSRSDEISHRQGLSASHTQKENDPDRRAPLRVVHSRHVGESGSDEPVAHTYTKEWKELARAVAAVCGYDPDTKVRSQKIRQQMRDACEALWEMGKRADDVNEWYETYWRSEKLNRGRCETYPYPAQVADEINRARPRRPAPTVKRDDLKLIDGVWHEWMGEGIMWKPARKRTLIAAGLVTEQEAP